MGDAILMTIIKMFQTLRQITFSDSAHFRPPWILNSFTKPVIYAEVSLHSAAEMIIMNFATSSAADAVVVAVLVVR